MKDFAELDLNSLNKVAGGIQIPESVDLLDPAEEEWRTIMKIVAQTRKSYLGTSLEQTIIDMQNSYSAQGMELIHLAEYLTPIWDTLDDLTP